MDESAPIEFADWKRIWEGDAMISAIKKYPVTAYGIGSTAYFTGLLLLGAPYQYVLIFFVFVNFVISYQYYKLVRENAAIVRYAAGMAADVKNAAGQIIFEKQILPLILKADMTGEGYEHQHLGSAIRFRGHVYGIDVSVSRIDKETACEPVRDLS